MGILLDLLKEIPLTAIMRERLIDQEAKRTVLETEKVVLKAENAELRARLK